MSLTYNTFVSSFANLLEFQGSEPHFVAMLPNAIDYSEQRIYRKLDLFAEIKRDSSSSLTANSRDFSLPTSFGNFRTIKGINVITPVGTSAANGTRNPLVLTSRDVVDLLWPISSSNTALPQIYGIIDNNSIIVGPSPDAGYVVEVVGAVRPLPLSPTNQTTYLSTFYPDLFLSGAMIFGSAFKGNFGAQGEDPKMAQSWEAQYQTLEASAQLEEARRQMGSN